MSASTETLEPTTGGRPHSLLTRLTFVPIAAAALALCCFRLAPIPGVEWYVGPIFYLFALKRWGLFPGLTAAVICMAPSIFWWGHPVSVVIALGHVTFVYWRGEQKLLVPSTLMYACAAYLAVGAPLLHFYYGAGAPVILLVLVRKIINDVTCAAIVDLLFVRWRFLENGRIVEARRPIGLAIFVRSWAHAGLLVIVLSAFMGSIGNFRQTFDYFSYRQLEDVRAELRNQSATHFDELAFLDITGDDGAFRVATAPRRNLMDSSVVEYLGCRTLGLDRDTKTFDELTDRCSLHTIGIQSGRNLYVMMADRGPALLAYSATVRSVLPELLLSVALTVLLAFAQWSLERDAGAWRTLLQGFGQRRIEAAPNSRFIEFSEPLREYVEANNAYVAAQDGSNERREAFRSLKRSLDLRVLRDITYDDETGVFRFLELTADGLPEPMKLQVHPSDRVKVSRAMRAELSAEFRLAGNPGQWWMIYGRGRDDSGGYERGLSFRLHQPRMAIEYLQQRARLQEIGVTTAATAHELQQPLMVVALAAEQGILQADQDRPAPISAHDLFDRILGQTRRAQRIVDRVSRRARLGDEERAVDPGLVIEDVIADLDPQLRRAGATAEVINRCEPDLRLIVSPTALEQVLINAIRNAADSISARGGGDPGRILITLDVGDGGDFQVTIEDNGAGLQPGGATAAFEPFYTTKAQGAGTGLGLYVSREIVEDWGGQLWLSPREPQGALFAMSLPAARIQV